MNTPDKVYKLGRNEVFVFGSNLAGRHGKGAALAALNFGAKRGLGVGLQGQTYAIPTKDWGLKVIPLDQILISVNRFIAFAEANTKLRFLVTPIGCGLAGYSPNQVAPMFKGVPGNVILPECFDIINES